ncbi:MAG: SDR family NAD(P)-dependent oxidoreductase [Nitrospirae bacterium]|nr:SDR family NAD(P)-dependent oxidoreductase [Nitrospirota bacterium]
MYAFVTGGSRGIGRAIVLALASAGYDVVFSYSRNKEAAQGTLEEIKQTGRVGFSVRMDISIEDEVKNAAGKAGRIVISGAGKN